MKYFDVLILEEAFEFLKSMDETHAEKILYNIRKAQLVKDPRLFKKLKNEIWEFRTLFKGNQYRLLAFWDKLYANNSRVIITNGLGKKSSKLPEIEFNKAIKIRTVYIKQQK